MPDGDELGDGWEYYIPGDEVFDQFDQYNFTGEAPPELSPEDLAAIELVGHLFLLLQRLLASSSCPHAMSGIGVGGMNSGNADLDLSAGSSNGWNLGVMSFILQHPALLVQRFFQAFVCRKVGACGQLM